MKILAYQQRHYIFFPAGIISLILLPLFCIIFLFKMHAFDKKVMMDVIAWHPGSLFLSKAEFLTTKKIHYNAVVLSGNDSIDLKAIASSQKLLHLIATNNSQDWE